MEPWQKTSMMNRETPAVQFLSSLLCPVLYIVVYKGEEDVLHFCIRSAATLYLIQQSAALIAKKKRKSPSVHFFQRLRIPHLPIEFF